MTKFYIAIVKGIERRRILGGYPTIEQAIMVGDTFVSNEPDHYHAVEIVAVCGTGESRIVNIAWMPDDKRERHHGRLKCPGKVAHQNEHTLDKYFVQIFRIV